MARNFAFVEVEDKGEAWIGSRKIYYAGFFVWRVDVDRLRREWWWQLA
jgi:hypothetical protein